MLEADGRTPHISLVSFVFEFDIRYGVVCSVEVISLKLVGTIGIREKETME